jgi:hypothetical protein
VRPSAPRTTATRRVTLRQRLIAAATERVTLKAAALFFALVLWLVVSAEEPTEARVDVRLNLLRSDTTVAIREPLPRVSALVVGRQRELLKLYAAPPFVRRTVTPDGSETAVIRLAPSDVFIPTGIDARVQDIQPRVVTVRLDVTAQRLVPVRSALTITADSGVRLVGAPRFDPESVRVTGRRGAVGAVDSVATARLSLVVRDSTPRTVPLDTAALGVRVTPSHVRVRVAAERDTAAPRDTAGRDAARRDTAKGQPPAGRGRSGRPGAP